MDENYFKLPAMAALSVGGNVTMTVRLNASIQFNAQGVLWIIARRRATMINDMMYMVISS
jgi:hypothetical protein